MLVQPYEKVSVVYDSLMKSVDYSSWTNYLRELGQKYIQSELKILELGSGTCKIAEHFLNQNQKILSSDISFQMLKSSVNGNLKRVCCNMTLLPFKSKFNFILCTFDSINYLTQKNQLLKLFKEVRMVLENGGIFTFDVSLETNSLNFVISKTTKYNFNGFEFQRVSQYNKHSKIHSNYFYIRDDSGQIFEETHRQRIYDLQTYFKISKNAGLKTEACYDYFTFNDINKNSERAQLVMTRTN